MLKRVRQAGDGASVVERAPAYLCADWIVRVCVCVCVCVCEKPRDVSQEVACGLGVR